MGLTCSNKTAIHLRVTFLGKLKNISIGRNTVVNSFSLIDGRGGCVIGSNCSISRSVVILSMGHEVDCSNFKLKGGMVVIKDNVWIGYGAIILPGVTIGKNAVVGAGSVVTKSIEENAVVVGNPARKIRERTLHQELTSVYFNPPFGFLS